MAALEAVSSGGLCAHGCCWCATAARLTPTGLCIKNAWIRYCILYRYFLLNEFVHSILRALGFGVHTILKALGFRIDGAD